MTRLNLSVSKKYVLDILFEASSLEFKAMDIPMETNTLSPNRGRTWTTLALVMIGRKVELFDGNQTWHHICTKCSKQDDSLECDIMNTQIVKKEYREMIVIFRL